VLSLRKVERHVSDALKVGEVKVGALHCTLTLCCTDLELKLR
jgi:hypothetical protein